MVFSGNTSVLIYHHSRDHTVVENGDSTAHEPRLTFDSTSIPGRPTRSDLGVLLIALIAGAIGLHRFSLNVAQHVGATPGAEQPGAGVIIRSQVIRVYLPEVLAQVATAKSRTHPFKTHDELKGYLEWRRVEGLWYALTIRVHQVNGGIKDLTFIRSPYDDPLHFDELCNILATAAGNPPVDSDSDYSQATVRIIQPETLKSVPLEVMAELLNDAPGPEERVGSP